MDRNIEQTYNIKASPEAVWRALTDPKEIQEWSGGRAYFIPQVGAQYTLWDGNIVGKIVEAIPQRKLVQTWKPQDWSRDDSVVTFTLTPTKDGTRVDLFHLNVEEFDYDGTTEGWDIYYLGVIKKMLEKRAKSAKPASAKKPAKKAAAKKSKPKAKKSAGRKKR
jgi:uncharacterized protein YndB with AHSA1/START domain